MSPQDKSQKSSLSSDVWTQRNLGIELPQNLGSVTLADVEYLCDKSYPFLQIINSEAIFAEETTINFITTSIGWVVHDYGDAISVSAPHHDKTKNRHMITTASEVADLIANKGWTSVELIAGTPKMQLQLWIELKRYGITLKGYEPSIDSEKIYDRLKKNTEASNNVWEKQVPEKIKDENLVSGAS